LCFVRRDFWIFPACIFVGLCSIVVIESWVQLQGVLWPIYSNGIETILWQNEIHRCDVVSMNGAILSPTGRWKPRAGAFQSTPDTSSPAPLITLILRCVLFYRAK